MINIIVCIKQIPDPEMPPSEFRVDSEARRPLLDNTKRVIGPYDENALETALQLRERAGEGKVAVVTAGTESAKDALRRALAVQADEAFLVQDDRYETLDAFGVARVLAAAIRKIGVPDFILLGRQSGDWDGGLVGGFLAEELRLPAVSLVSRMEPADGSFRVKRVLEDAVETVELTPPAVLTVTNDGSNSLRLAKVRDMMMAARKPITEISWSQLGLDVSEPAALCQTQLVDLRLPERQPRCEFIDGETEVDKAVALARRLREMKII